MNRTNGGQFEKGTHWRKPRQWWDREWLEQQYITQMRSAADIAKEGGATENNIFYWLKKHGITTRSMSEIRAAKHWGLSGVDNPMWNRRGDLNPNWKGGITPERQDFYMSREWKTACSEVWKRDDAKCQRCGLTHDDSPDMPMHIHHIKSFAVVGLRANTANLILVCEACHRFIHSKENIEREYLP